MTDSILAALAQTGAVGVIAGLLVWRIGAKIDRMSDLLGKLIVKLEIFMDRERNIPPR